MAGLSERNFRNAIATQKTFLGGSTFKEDFEKDQRAALSEDSAKVLREYEIAGEAEVIGRGVSQKKIDVSQIPSVARKQKLGAVTTFNLAGQIDLMPIAQKILARLHKLSGPFKLTGAYQASHRIVDADRKRPQEYIYVGTDSPYAAKLERPKRYFRTGRTYRVYQRVALWASKKWLGEAHIWLTTGPRGAPSIEIRQFEGQRPYSASKAPKWGRGRRRRGSSYARAKGRN
jgi:hypothetical protein